MKEETVAGLDLKLTRRASSCRHESLLTGVHWLTHPGVLQLPCCPAAGRQPLCTSPCSCAQHPRQLVLLSTPLPPTQRYKIANRLPTRLRYGLTGTPFQNDYSGGWASTFERTCCQCTQACCLAGAQMGLCTSMPQTHHQLFLLSVLSEIYNVMDFFSPNCLGEKKEFNAVRGSCCC